jgi:prolyl oligopeptidase
MKVPVMRAVAFLMCITGVLLFAAATASTPDDSDPYIWLEDVHGERAMDWVKAENAKTSAALDNDALYRTLFSDAKTIAESRDRIPQPNLLHGAIYNLWQDAEHVHGIWRRTSLADYQSAAPHWHTVIDLDALSKAESANWFWKGARCTEPSQRRCMIALSDGGEDATTLREFDLDAGQFVEGGLTFPRGKQPHTWETEDTLLVAREWSAGELTHSGYPFVIKRIKRGAPMSAATEVFRGTADDVIVTPFALSDGAGHRAAFVRRAVSFFESEHFLVDGNSLKKLSLPMKCNIIGLVQGQLVVDVNEDWKVGAASLPQGSLISLDLAALKADPLHLHPIAIYQPAERQALASTDVTRTHVLVHLLDEVNGRAYSYTMDSKHRWSRVALPIPENASVDIAATDVHSDVAFVSIAGFLTPTRMMLADLNKNTLTEAKSLPAKFDASKDVVEQFQAASADGTKIPYFIVHPAHLQMDGSTPTIIYAYGGFQASQTPGYSAELGKLWLERGGAYVLANIRGGGEFGPAWHEAGLKTKRQKIYDDFAAVAQDLIARRFTSPAHLGIRGGSNGGLLMGVEFTQHPEMWAAVDIGVPLLDMLRFEQIAAGSLWVGEYGSVTKPDEKAFLASISPYNNLKPNVRYPQAFIWTTTKDDRVGPQHARKFAAKLSALGVPYYYYEVIEGGHGSGSTPAEHAQMAAREYTYFARKLSL